MKICSVCGKNKELEAFSKKSSNKDGLDNKCKLCAIAYQVKYRAANKEKISESHKKYHIKNKVRKSIYDKNYRLNNKEKVDKYHREYTNKRSKNDIFFKLANSLRQRLNKAIKHSYKSGSAVTDLGCSVEDLKIYLESKFQPGMSWDNYGFGIGKWNIDHIVPLSKFDISDRVQLLIACNYTNLQPMWHIDNIRKGNRLQEEYIYGR